MASPGPSFLTCPPSQPHRYPNASRDFRYKNGPHHGENFNNSNWIYIPPPYPNAGPPCPVTQSSNSPFSPPTVQPPPYSRSYLSTQPSLPLTPPQSSYPSFPQIPQSSAYTVPPPPFPSHNQAIYPPPLPNYPPPQQPSPPSPSPPSQEFLEPSHTPPLPPPSYTPPPPPLPSSPPPPLPPSPPPIIPPLPPSPPTTPCDNEPQTSIDHADIEESGKVIQNRDKNLNRRYFDNHHPQKIINSKGKKRKSLSSCDDETYLPNKWKKIEDLIDRLDNEEQKKLQGNYRIEASYTSKDHERNKNYLYCKKDYIPKKNMSLYDLSKAKAMSHSTRRSSCDSLQRQRKDESYFNCGNSNDSFHSQEDYDDSKDKRRKSLDIALSDEDDITDEYLGRKRSYFSQKDLDSNSRWKKVYDSLNLDDEIKTNVDGSLQDLSEAYDSYYNLNDHQKDSYNGSYFDYNNQKKCLYEKNKSFYTSHNYCTVKSEIHVVKNTKQNSSYSRERYNSINDSNFDTESIYSTDESDNETDRSSKKISNKHKYSKKKTRTRYELCEFKDRSYSSDHNNGLDSDSSLSAAFDHSSNNSKSNLKYFENSVCNVYSESKLNEIRNTGYSVAELITKENCLDFSNKSDEQWKPKKLNGMSMLKNNSNNLNDCDKYTERLENIKNLNNDFICSSFISILKYNNSNRHIIENNNESHNEEILHSDYENILRDDADYSKDKFMPKCNNSDVNLLKNKLPSTQSKEHQKDVVCNSKQQDHISDPVNLDRVNSTDGSNIEIYLHQVEKVSEDYLSERIPNYCPDYSNNINKSPSKEKDVSDMFDSMNKTFYNNLERNNKSQTKTNNSNNKHHRTNLIDVNPCHRDNLIEDIDKCNQYKLYSTTSPDIQSETNKNTNNKSYFSNTNDKSGDEGDKMILTHECQLENQYKNNNLPETKFLDSENYDLMNREENMPQNNRLDCKNSEIFENNTNEITSIGKGEEMIESKLSYFECKNSKTDESYSPENKSTTEAVSNMNYNISMKKHNKENISKKEEKVESPLNITFEQIETSLSCNVNEKVSRDIFKLSTSQNSFRSKNSFLILNENIERNMSNLNADHNANIDNKEYSCTKCKRKFSTLGGLKEHLLYHKGGTFECVKCGEKFFKLIDMTLHIRIHIEQKYSTDTVCSHGNKDDNNTFESESSIESNENNKLVNVEQVKGINDTHSTHDSNRYEYESSEKNHHKKSLSSMKLRTKIQKTKYFSCSYCDYKSKREKLLLRHLKKHLNNIAKEDI